MPEKKKKPSGFRSFLYEVSCALCGSSATIHLLKEPKNGDTFTVVCPFDGHKTKVTFVYDEEGNLTFGVHK